jgi:hypothetical protein
VTGCCGTCGSILFDFDVVPQVEFWEKESSVPIPKKLKSKVSTIIAAQTSRLEKKGMSPAVASKAARKMADKFVKDHSKGGKKSKKKGK